MDLLIGGSDWKPGLSVRALWWLVRVFTDLVAQEQEACEFFSPNFSAVISVFDAADASGLQERSREMGLFRAAFPAEPSRLKDPFMPVQVHIATSDPTVIAWRESSSGWKDCSKMQSRRSYHIAEIKWLFWGWIRGPRMSRLATPHQKC